MSRRLKQTFNCEPLDGLTRQLIFSPVDKRTRQVKRIERLHDQLDPAKNYPLDFLFYRITGYRREDKDAVVLAGEAVLPDLRLMIDSLSRSMRMAVDENDPVETIHQLADRLGVSTKTIGRWRRAGMRWRWIAPTDGGRKAVAVPRSASDRFIQDHPSQVSRAVSFTQIDPEARRRLIQRARQIVRRKDVSLNQVAAHLATKTGRGLETIRQLLANHDRDHPGRAVFADHTGPLSSKQKRVIVRAYRVGVPIDRITARFRRTRSTIYRAIHQHGAGKAGRVSLAYIASPIFDRDDADEVILGHPVQTLMRHRKTAEVSLDNLPKPVHALFRQPVIPPDRVRTLFVRYNFVKGRAVREREQFDRYNPGAMQVKRFEQWIEQARELRDFLVQIHLPVVLSVSRRNLIGDTGPAGPRLMELLEQGLVVLIQSVESFNPGRQRRFDPFLTNRLLGRFATEPESTTDQPRQAHRRGAENIGLKQLTDVAAEAGVVLIMADSGLRVGD